MDLEYLVRRDKLDLALSDTGVKKKWNDRDTGKNVKFRSRKHVTVRLNELCDSTLDRHIPSRAAEIQEVCEEIAGEHETEIVDAFSGTKVLGYGGAAWKVCVTSASSCTAEEFQAALPYSNHLKAYPMTRETKGQIPSSPPLSASRSTKEL